jgi:hypothetical protein
MFVGKQQRYLARKARNHCAWITFDDDIRSHECHELDISPGGAKPAADIDAIVGSSFILSVAPKSLVRKPCEAVWRRGRQIGVKFSNRASKPS